MMRSSVALFDGLADDYEGHFAVAHRKAYDDLAWEVVSALLPPPPGPVIDAGCGTGRWARRLVAQGYRVTGIEQAPAMIAVHRRRPVGESFDLVEGSMAHVVVPPNEAAMVLAMGSLQFNDEPDAVLARLAGWTRPNGVVCVLVDSLLALALELVRAGRTEEAVQRLQTRRGVWREGGRAADLHLYDRARLEQAMGAAGLRDVRIRGLLVGSTAFGRESLSDRLQDDPDRQLGVERLLADEPLLADAGKHLLAVGRR
jgi:SAM-dependent methyltransferase